MGKNQITVCIVSSYIKERINDILKFEYYTLNLDSAIVRSIDSGSLGG